MHICYSGSTGEQRSHLCIREREVKSEHDPRLYLRIRSNADAANSLARPRSVVGSTGGRL